MGPGHAHPRFEAYIFLVRAFKLGPISGVNFPGFVNSRETGILKMPIFPGFPGKSRDSRPLFPGNSGKWPKNPGIPGKFPSRPLIESMKTSASTGSLLPSANQGKIVAY